MSSPKIEIVLVDDHALLRQSLQSYLAAEDDLDVIAFVESADQAIDLCLRYSPDVLVMDIDMPGLSCFEAADILRRSHPDLPIILLSAHMHDRYIEQALRACVDGFVCKSDPPSCLVQAIRTAHAGKPYFSQAIVERLSQCAQRTRAHLLSARELEVMRLLAQGLSKKQVATRLCISVNTVDNHASRLMNKLDIHDRVELTRYAIREGYVTA